MGSQHSQVCSNGLETLKIHLLFFFWLVVEPTHLKNMLVKMGFIFPKFRDENTKIFETIT